MNTFGVLFVCFQICLIQNACAQCVGPAGPIPNGLGYLGYGISSGIRPGIGPGIAPTPDQLEVPLGAGYGGAGVGDVAVAGEMPVAGTTLVTGQVPILGAVRFAGDLPAAGTVIIAGSCGCGCGASGYYY